MLLSGKLIVLYDDNHITIDGDTNLSFTEDVGQRYAAYGWHVQVVDDVNNLDALRTAIQAAKEVEDRPSIIKVLPLFSSDPDSKCQCHRCAL
jgi:transketolase